MKHFLLTITLILVMVIMSFGKNKRNVSCKHSWKYIDFTWNIGDMADWISRGKYDPRKCFIDDVAKSDDGTLFATVPKDFGEYTPATLATVSNEIGEGGPLLNPYPDWSWHTRNCKCDRIVNAKRICIKCNHLFVLDNGRIGDNQICTPKLLIFNLELNELVETIYISLDIATNTKGIGTLVTPAIYIPGKCSRMWKEMIVFIADIYGYGLIMYDASTKRMCRIESDFMKPSPSSTTFSIANVRFRFVGGISFLAVLDDVLCFAPASDKTIYGMNISKLATCPNKIQANNATKIIAKLRSQTGPIASTEQALFYSDLEASCLLGQNTRGSTTNPVLLAQDSDTLQGISALTISDNCHNLCGMSNRHQNIISDRLNTGIPNFCYFEIDLSNKCIDNYIQPTKKYWFPWLSWIPLIGYWLG